MNKSSKDRLAKVHPELATRITKTAATLAARGTTIEVVQGLRTYAEQDALYAQGRTKPGKKVTNARGGQSNHNFGLAVDVCPFVSGKPNWDAPQTTWERIGEAGEAEGLEWGGNWSSIVDMPHLQLPGMSVATCRKLYEAGGLPKVWAAVKLPEKELNGFVEPALEPATTATSTEIVKTTVVEETAAGSETKETSIVSKIIANEQVKTIASEGVTKLAGKAVGTLGAAGAGGAAGAATASNPWPWIILAIVCLLLIGGVVWFVLWHKSRKENQAAAIASDKDRTDIAFKKA